MSVQVNATAFDADAARAHDEARWAGTPLAAYHWLESVTGFPEGSVGATGLGQGTSVVATARGFALNQRQLDEVTAFAEFLAGRALPAAQRVELCEDVVDAFEDSPKTAVQHLRPLAGGITAIRSLDPIDRAERRLQALTASYAVEQRRQSDDAEPSPIMAVVAEHNPLVRYWASTGVVLTADALSSRYEQHRLVLGLAGREPEAEQSLSGRLLDALADAGELEIAGLAAAQPQLLCLRSWLRDLGDAAEQRLRAEVGRAVASALDVDIVVQQVAFRAAFAVEATRSASSRSRAQRTDSAARAAR